MLIVAAEDYTGASPGQAGGPNYLDYYTDALDANGTGYDVYDVDDRGRIASDALGVLSHYDAVIWYTGDDIVTRELEGIDFDALPRERQRLVALAIFRRETGIMAVSAFVVFFLALRAAGTTGALF